MSKPLVSVVLPSYNHARFVGQAIESVLRQDHRPLELVVIDDGSTDDSVRVIEALLPKAKKAGVAVQFRARANRGAHVTINECLDLAKGDWLTILNSDDYFMPKRLSKLLAAAKKSKSDFIFSKVLHVDEDDEPIPDHHVFREWYIDGQKRDYPTLGFRILDDNVAVTTGNFFFSRDLYEAIGAFGDYTLVHDYDFLLRSLAYTEPHVVLEDLIAYRVHGGNTISNLAHLTAEEGPEVAHEFIMRTFLNPNPRNEKAPWARGQRKYFEAYWKGRTGRGAIRNWLGQMDLSDQYDDALYDGKCGFRPQRT